MAKTGVRGGVTVGSGYTQRTELKSLRMMSSPEMKRAEALRLREAAEIVAMKCREIASQFSRRIPASIKVQGGTSRVVIVAGGPAAPNAYPFEKGAYHPLFAHGPRGSGPGWKNWYKQPYKPFLEEGAAIAGNDAERAFAKVIDDWLGKLNLPKA